MKEKGYRRGGLLYCALSKHKWNNLFNYIFRYRMGHFTLEHGQKVFYWGDVTKSDALGIFLLSERYGAKIKPNMSFFGIDDYVWLLSKSVSEVVLAETFLYDAHYIPDLKGKVVVQGGGFTGDTAIYYGKLGAHVYSFEPDYISYNVGLENLKLNEVDDVVFDRKALGKDEIIDFYSTGKANNSKRNNAGSSMKTFSISLKTLLSNYHIEDPYLLDLDIKGSELSFLEDTDSVKKFKWIRIEYQGNLYDIQEFFNRIGDFKVERIFKPNEGSYSLANYGVIIYKKKLL
ncbi:MAG: FkbM family methyltransferase [Candidatus Parvarchaeum sp.]